MLVALLGGQGCAAGGVLGRRSAPAAGLAEGSRSDPALSGDGRVLASLLERDGRDQVLLQELPSGRPLPLRQLQRRQLLPHSAPSLSWNGRYLALLVREGNRTRIVVEDRLSGRLLRLPLPGDGEPERLSLAADGTRLAVQMLRRGQRQVQVFSLAGLLEPDLGAGSRVLGGGATAP